MSLTNLEKETIILFNEAEPTASIQIHNPRLRRRLEQIHAARPSEVAIDYNGDYLIPKSWIKINPKRNITLLTEEQKHARAELLRIARSRLNS